MTIPRSTRFARCARSLGLLTCLAAFTFTLGPAVLLAQNPSQPPPPTKQPRLPTTRPIDPTPATPSRGKSRQGKSEESPSTSSSEPQASEDSVAAADREFALQAAEDGLLQIALGRLAVQQASSPDVKQLGQRMIDDHRKMNEELTTIAGGKRIALPGEAQARTKHQATIARLETLSGDAFDRAYVADMATGHAQEVARFDREASRGQDPELQAFARKTLPIVRDHLALVRDAERKRTAKGTH